MLRPISALGLDKRLPMLVTLVMIVLLAQSLALLTWKILPSPTIQTINPAATAGTVGRPAAQDRSQVQQISEWHLFGEAAKAVSTPVKAEVAPDTRLNLKLRGVLASKNPDLASAIIADQRGTEDAYVVGDTLPGDAILREIHSDRVILEYRGRLETLRLPKDETPGVGVSGHVSQTPGINQKSDAGLNTATADTSALLAQYREALVNDPQSLMDLVRATPVADPDSGQLKGYRISPGKDRRLLGRFGLRSGDVVTGVNGVTLDNPIKALEIMQELSTASSVSLQVERRGEPLNLEFQVDE